MRGFPGVLASTVFGQSMHLLVDESLPNEQIRERLREAGIQEADIRPIAASLEDVFVALTDRHSSSVPATQGKGT